MRSTGSRLPGDWVILPFFDLLSRLQISTSHREIERFVEAEIDFTLFHNSLLNLVSYLNGIHESYVAKALGLEKYRKY
jgi:hypothetical protein